MHLKSILPRRMVALRHVHSLSLRGLSRETGIAGSTLHLLETGFSADVLLSTILRLCEALAVTPDYLLGVERDPNHAHALLGEGLAGHCPVCLADLAPHAPHRLGECIRQHHHRGASVKQLAARYGLCVSSVERILQDEYALLRRGRAA